MEIKLGDKVRMIMGFNDRRQDWVCVRESYFDNEITLSSANLSGSAMYMTLKKIDNRPVEETDGSVKSQESEDSNH